MDPRGTDPLRAGHLSLPQTPVEVLASAPVTSPLRRHGSCEVAFIPFHVPTPR